MANLDYKQFARRHRPHINPPDAGLFVTYRLAGSIPKSVVRDYRARKAWLETELRRVRSEAACDDSPELISWLERVEVFNRRWLLKFETILHQAEVGPTWMRDRRIADAVAESLRALDGEAFRLDAYSVMSNHVHSIFKPFLSEANLREIRSINGHPLFISEYPGLSRIMHSVKGRSARECNVLLERRGQFWEHESFDHVIRAGKLHKTISYVLDNPVKVGLSRKWEDFRWNYCRKELFEDFRTI